MPDLRGWGQVARPGERGYLIVRATQIEVTVDTVGAIRRPYLMMSR